MAAFPKSSKRCLGDLERRLVLASMSKEAETEEAEDHHCPASGFGDCSRDWRVSCANCWIGGNENISLEKGSVKRMTVVGVCGETEIACRQSTGVGQVKRKRGNGIPRVVADGVCE